MHHQNHKHLEKKATLLRLVTWGGGGGGGGGNETGGIWKTVVWLAIFGPLEYSDLSTELEVFRCLLTETNYVRCIMKYKLFCSSLPFPR